MRASLQALTDELRRLKAGGVSALSVSEESLQRLRAVVAARRPPQSADPLPAASASGPSRAARLTPPAPEAMPPAKPPAPSLPPPPVVTLPADGDKSARLAWLHDYVVNHPVVTANLRPGKRAVLGVGNPDAAVMFVGEAPGAEEEIQGEPFVGPAGQLLDKMIGAMGLQRGDVYIGNIMNWRPQLPNTPDGGEQIGNRPPTPEELAFCLPFLRAQIEIVRPRLLVALGSTAAQGLLGPGSFTALGQVRGKWHDFNGKPAMVTYHPSYILRNNSNRSKRMIWEDLLKVMERADIAISERQRGYFLGK
ncbi:MAG: uracil-DNA glycosylase [Verrucomicrobiota bacterium]